MNQFEGQRSNQYLNQQNTKLTLQRSVSPICKLILFNNLSSNTKVQKSMRAKDDTLILDVQLYLEQQHQNQYIITLYHNNNPINVDKNTYLLPYLQKLKIQSLDYKADLKRLYCSDIGIEDEGPGLEQKLSERDSSSWGLNIKNRLDQSKTQYQQKNVNQTLNQQSNPKKQDQQHFQSDGHEKNQNYPLPQEIDQQISSQKKNEDDQTSTLNQSELTFKSIECQCKHSYNSYELRKILQNAIYKNLIAECKYCNKKIPRSMYQKISELQNIYQRLKLSLEIQILKDNLIRNFNLDIQDCQQCNFFCIWDKNKPSTKGFCPNCIQNGIIYKKKQ